MISVEKIQIKSNKRMKVDEKIEIMEDLENRKR